MDKDKRNKIIAAVLAGTLIIVTGVSIGINKNEHKEYEYNKDMKNSSVYTDVDYYGCPNSKRIKKLNINKTYKRKEDI